MILGQIDGTTAQFWGSVVIVLYGAKYVGVLCVLIGAADSIVMEANRIREGEEKKITLSGKPKAILKRYLVEKVARFSF